MRKCKKIVTVLTVAAIMASVLGGCTNQGKEETVDAETNQETAKTEASGEEETAPGGLKIGVIYLTSEHPYYQAHAKHTQEYAAQKGIELIELDGKLDQSVMANHIENLIAQKVDGIIYCLVEGTAASSDIQLAQEAGIPILTFAIPHNTEKASCPFVGIDEFSAGEIGGKAAGEYYAEKFPGVPAKVGIVEEPNNPTNVQRSEGFIAGFKSVVDDMEVIARMNGEGKKDKAMAVTEDMIQAHAEVNVIYGSNGDSGLGALSALEASGRGTSDKELVISHDGSEPEVLKIADPDSALKVAVANQPKELAYATIDTILEMIEGKREMTNTDNIFIPATSISAKDLETAQEFIRKEYFSEVELVK